AREQRHEHLLALAVKKIAHPDRAEQDAEEQGRGRWHGNSDAVFRWLYGRTWLERGIHEPPRFPPQRQSMRPRVRCRYECCEIVRQVELRIVAQQGADVVSGSLLVTLAQRIACRGREGFDAARSADLFRACRRAQGFGAYRIGGRCG